MWYIVDCDPGATLIYGFRQALTKQELRERIEANTLMDVVNEVPVHKGDVFFIEATTLHAIGKGNPDRRNPAEQQHHLPGIRLRAPGRGRQAAPPAY